MIALLINECSLDEYVDCAAALGFFRQASRDIKDAKVECQLLRDSGFFSSVKFRQRYSGLPLQEREPGERALIKQMVFGDGPYACWRPTRRSTDEDLYECADPAGIFGDDTVAEAAKRTLARNEPMQILLSAPDSKFGGRSSIALASGGVKAEPKVASTFAAVEEHLAGVYGHFDAKSGAAPKDFQTALRKHKGRFRYTGKRARLNRKIYEEEATGRLFYVDEGHPGQSAHLEVFSAEKEHLGTADINDATLKPNTAAGHRLFL